MKVVYDGWPLAYRPNSPAAIHLRALLEAHVTGGAEQLRALAALPAAPFEPLPEGVETMQILTPDSARGRLDWEQRRLPEIARRAAAAWVHTTGTGLALLGATPGVLSRTDFDGEAPGAFRRQQPRERPSLAGRLQEALALGGQARARAQFWPDDLPDYAAGRPTIPVRPPAVRLPPAVHPWFHPAGEGPAVSAAAVEALSRLDLPQTYILYHGPSDDTGLRCLLDAWSWAAGAIGEYYPLLLVGLEPQEQERLAALLAEYQLTGTARSLPSLGLVALADLYRGSTAVFHPFEEAAWGGPVRLALASARPVVGLETPWAAAICGPGAYLVRSDLEYAEERRALGAALLTVVVEESLAEALSRQARKRAEVWSFSAFQQGLQRFYLAVAQHPTGKDRHAHSG